MLDSALSVGTLPGALLRTLVAQQAYALAAREVFDLPSHENVGWSDRVGLGGHGSCLRRRRRVAGAFRIRKRTTLRRRRSEVMYIGVGTVVLILVVVLLVAMMRRGSRV